MSIPSSAPSPHFAGFPPEAFAWFRELADNNNRSWFTAHRETWEDTVQGPLEALLVETADRNGGDVRIFRPHRDIRFSPDKRPYKERTYGIVSDGSGGSAWYAELSAGGLYVGGGYYAMAGDQVDRFRSAVADEATGTLLEEIVATLEAGGLQVEGNALKTAPRGVDRSHPRIRLLRMKEIIAGARLVYPADADILADRRALDFAQRTWGALEPLSGWLDTHVGPSTTPPEVRWGRGGRR